MESIEITGETVEEAIAKGLAELQAAPNEVMVTVLEEPRGGLFGLGSHPARVRLDMIIKRPSAPLPVVVSGAPEPVAPAASEPAEADFYVEEDEGEYSEFSAGETTEDDANVGKVVLDELLEKMGVAAKVNIRRAESARQDESAPWLLDVSVSNMNLLIGRRGETLAALQYVTRLIASRRLERRANIIVDVGGYKLRRSQQLRQLATRMADQAVKQRRTITLEPMPPNERRIIHITLRNRADVYTKSVGDGESRKVTIVPK